LIRAAYAESLWDLHGDQAANRFVVDLLDTLDFRGVDAPLLRTRDYSGWSDQLNGLLWGLLLGIAVVKHAPLEHRPAAMAHLFPQLRRRLAGFRAGLWHRYGDPYSLLAELVDDLARWTEEPTATAQDVEAFEAVFQRVIVPGIWRLRATLASRTLAERHMTDLTDWAASPSSSPSICPLGPQGGAKRAVYDHLQRLETARPGDAAQIQAVRTRLNTWWARFSTEL
jgi:hypothetical protein